ncbi:hypothetical protein [Tardiphaga sp. OK245]|nr:hypothetical protein [Tardiphaga sp. OK245]SEI19080.1 hypothetical protein SAMN05216367_4769 [Tardiphaga sp. OK245]
MRLVLFALGGIAERHGPVPSGFGSYIRVILSHAVELASIYL